MRIFTAIKITTTKKEFFSEIYICTEEFIVLRIEEVMCKKGKKKHKLWKIALLRKQRIIIF